jgi:hypothetical protein
LSNSGEKSTIQLAATVVAGQLNGWRKFYARSRLKEQLQ